MSLIIKKLTNAFTLIETLLVLLIISFVLLFASLYPNKDITEKIESRLFFDQVVAGLNLAQGVSVLQETQVNVRFWKNLPYIEFQVVGQVESISQIKIPEFWYLETTLTFTHYPDGRTNNFSTVVFRHREGQRVEIVFQLGSGKFEIRQ